MLRPWVPQAPVISIAIVLHLTTALLTELLADTFHAPVLVPDAVQAPLCQRNTGPNCCSPGIALRIYNAVTGARALYAFSLVTLRASQWEILETELRSGIRRFFGLLRTSPVGMTYAETNQFPLSLRAKACALRHVERLHITRGGKVLVNRLLSLPDIGMGRSSLEYAGLISGLPVAGLLTIPPHWDSRLPISIGIPGIRSKGHTPRAAPTTGNLRHDQKKILRPPPSIHRRLGEQGRLGCCCQHHSSAPRRDCLTWCAVVVSAVADESKPSSKHPPQHPSPVPAKTTEPQGPPLGPRNPTSTDQPTWAVKVACKGHPGRWNPGNRTPPQQTSFSGIVVTKAGKGGCERFRRKQRVTVLGLVPQQFEQSLTRGDLKSHVRTDSLGRKHCSRASPPAQARARKHGCEKVARNESKAVQYK
ncbi:hypothetical protein MRX96_039939 [Rhipicephalus microplus]